MAPGQGTQLEKIIDEVLKIGDAHKLDVFLQSGKYEGAPIKCSQQFLIKLDKLVSRSLDKKDSRSASLGFAILNKCGCQGLSGLLAQGLLKKMVQWFEKCRQLWIQCGPHWDETLFNLSEDFLDALMVVHEACKEGTTTVTESFLYPVGQLAVDPRVHILIQKEAVRKFNMILDKISVELKKERKLLTSEEASDIMMKLAGQILKSGDYDLQTALMEALCRMATPIQRKELADVWFNMEHVTSAFVKIRDSEFETDCRMFLNLVNGMQGDRRRVYSYPCLEAYLDKHELLMPADEKLEEFWIDFNLDSHSISFYFSLSHEEGQEGQWETICITENEIQSYTVTEEGLRKVLQVKMSQLVVVGAMEGSSLTIHFSSSLDILQAAHTVYGHSKNKGFVGKTGTSVVKTTVKIIMENNSSQVVPESQMSLGESEKNTAPYPVPAVAAPVQMVTPNKRRISESTTFISGSAGGSVHGASSLSAVMSSNNSAKGKGKPSLEMVRSCDKQGEFYLGELRTTANKTWSNGTTPNRTVAGGMTEQSTSSLQSKASKLSNKNRIDKQKKSIAVAKEDVPTGLGEEQYLESSFLPDTQPRSGGNTSLNWNKLSVSEMLMMPTQKISSVSRSESCSSVTQQQQCLSSAQRSSVTGSCSITQKQLYIELTKRMQKVLDESNQDIAPPEPSEPQIKMSNISKDSKGKSSLDLSASSLCTSEEQQTKRNGQAKRKSKHPMSPIKVQAKASTTKALHKKTPPSVEVDTKGVLSSKEKRDAEVAGSMVKLISSRYEMNTQTKAKHTVEIIPKSWIPPLVNRPIFNMRRLSSYQRDVSGAINKFQSKKATNASVQRKDVYAFNTKTPLNAGGKNETLTHNPVISNSGFHDSSEFFSTSKKKLPVAKEKRRVKKHLFSDTDTDCVMTDVSWLRESSRKPKPKVTTYSRQAPVKPDALSPHTSYESQDLPPTAQKPAKGNAKLNKKKPKFKEREERPNKTLNPAVAPSRLQAAGRRPRRTAATCTKSYREPDTDESQSESEKSPVSKKKHFVGQQQEAEKTRVEVPEVKKGKTTSPDQSWRPDHNKSHLKKPSGLKVGTQPSTKQQRTENILPKTSKLNKKDVIPAQEQTNGLKDSWAARETSFCPSPPFIERMRSAERSAPTLGLTGSPLLTPRGSPLPASPSPPCMDTPSPILLLPKPLSLVSSKGHLRPSSFYSAEKKRNPSKNHSPSLTSVTHISQTRAPSAPTGPSPAETNPIQLQLPSAAQSPLTLSPRPLMTPTLKPLIPSPPQSPFPEDTVSHRSHFDYSKVSSVSLVSLSQSSTKSSATSSRVRDSPNTALGVSLKKEKTPSTEKEPKSDQLLISGPSRKRHISLSSNSDEDEKEERKKSRMRGQQSPRMKPRKLFKSLSKPHGQAQSCGEQSNSEKDEIKDSKAKDRNFKVKMKKITGGYQNIKNKTLRDSPHDTVVEVSADREISRVTSSHSMSFSHWEAEAGDGDMDLDEEFRSPELAVNPSNLCQQFSSELKKKFQNRYNMVEVYNKQSLKTMQQHISSLNKQVMKQRTQRLEQVQKVLLEEIRKLEQDDIVLKNMEKDMSMYWKKQSVAFHSYHEQETLRNEALRKALQSNVCHGLEYEERIFTSQMCLIRNDMKSVQDRLLSEMQEGEIQSVKRGLHALFFP